jgi:hypothetical protein
MNKPTTDKAKKIASSATLIGVVAGVPFYESPAYGDESPLLYITKDGRVKISDYWELPDYDELMDFGPADAFYKESI